MHIFAQKQELTLNTQSNNLLNRYANINNFQPYMDDVWLISISNFSQMPNT